MEIDKIMEKFDKSYSDNPLYDLALGSSGVKWGVFGDNEKDKGFYQDRLIGLLKIFKKHEKFLKSCIKLSKEIDE